MRIPKETCQCGASSRPGGWVPVGPSFSNFTWAVLGQLGTGLMPLARRLGQEPPEVTQVPSPRVLQPRVCP